MSEDRMKDFIQSQKSKFEAEEPSSDLWNSIERSLPKVTEEKKVKMVSVKRMWSMVGGVAAVFAIAFALTTNFGKEAPLTGTKGSQLNNVNQIETYYTSQVNDRLEKLKSYQVDEDILEEVHLLKLEFDELKSEADKGFNQEEILDFMIDNYRMRVTILEDIMREVQSKSNNDQKHVTQ